jgi:hypothetical protein
LGEMGVILPEMRRQRKRKRQEIMRPLCVRIKNQFALVKILEKPLQCCRSVNISFGSGSTDPKSLITDPVAGGQLITDQAGSGSGSYLSICMAIEIKLRCQIRTGTGIVPLNVIQYFTSF